MRLLSILFLTVLTTINNIAAQESQVSSNVPVASSRATATSGLLPTVVSGSGILPTGSSMVLTAIVSSAIPVGSGSVSAGVDQDLANLPVSGSFGNTVYPGTATFIQPTSSKSVLPLYRINPKENVTFVWSFTDMLIQPQTLNLAAVAPNKVTYSITQLPGAATSAVWYLSDIPPASPLMMGTYTIQLYDQRGISAYPSPGWLSPVTSLKIALYSAEPYAVGSTESGYCPYCFYNSGKRLKESIGTISIAFSIATITSILILYGLFN